MKEYVLMSKESGDTALGMKLQMFDNPDERLMNDGLGRIAWLPKDPDFWGVRISDDNGFIVLPFKLVDEKTEVIAEL